MAKRRRKADWLDWMSEIASLPPEDARKIADLFPMVLASATSDPELAKFYLSVTHASVGWSEHFAREQGTSQTV